MDFLSNLAPDEGKVFQKLKLLTVKNSQIYPATPEEQTPFIKKTDKDVRI